MAKKHHKSKSLPSRNRPSSVTPPVPQTRDDILENERLRLMKAHSLLGCITRAMENDGVCTGDGPYWPAAIESVSELVNESIRRLEGLEYGKANEQPVSEVREPAVIYEVRPLH